MMCKNGGLQGFRRAKTNQYREPPNSLPPQSSIDYSPPPKV
jgi:hypothetical protein